MRVGIIGSGATGGYLAARLAQADVPVVLVARGESYTRIQAEGVTITEPDGTVVTSRPEAVIEPGVAAAEPVDLVLFCVKSYDTEKAGHALSALAGNHARVLCLQNGVKNEEILAELLGPTRLLSGVLYIGSQRVAPGVIECASAPRLLVGEYSSKVTSRASEVVDLLRSANLEATQNSDVRGQKWQKFLFNCALNPLTAILQRQLGEILARPTGSELYGSLVEEAIAVGKAHGAPIADDASEKVWEQGHRMAHIFSSMAEDVRAGRPLEVDTFTGYVHDLGQRLGVATPTSDVILQLLKTMDAAAL